ncbi:MAG: 50S ribosomal protein L10 [bacterium]|nr:50S ribosomal protein L10 [bacterium]
MPKTRDEKEGIIRRLTDEFKNAASVVFADYQGLSVTGADEMRSKMRDADVNYMVAKKTLITRAAKDAGFDLDASSLNGMIGIAFGTEDVVAPARVLGEMAKTTTVKLVGGIFEGEVVGEDKVIALSKLPSKHVLLGQVVGTIYAPVSAFVRTLNAIREKQEAGA